MDVATIVNSVRKTGRCLTVEEGWFQSGVGAEITAQVVESKIEYHFVITNRCFRLFGRTSGKNNRS